LSADGRRLIVLTRRWISAVIELLKNKADGNELQDFIWCLKRARFGVDIEDLGRRAGKARGRADANAGEFASNPKGHSN